MSELDDIARKAQAEGGKTFDQMSTNEQIGRLLSARGGTQETIRDADARASYFGKAGADFDREALDGNRVVAERARQELSDIDGRLAKRGVTNIDKEERDFIGKTGRHRVN